MFFDDIYNEKIIECKDGFFNPKKIGNVIFILFCVC